MNPAPAIIAASWTNDFLTPGSLISSGSRSVWGDYFRSKKRDDAIVLLREHNLTEYLRSIQKKQESFSGQNRNGRRQLDAMSTLAL